MNLRAWLSAALVMLMPVMTVGAGACDLSCAFGQLRGACESHGTAAASGGAQGMSGMDMSGMAMPHNVATAGATPQAMAHNSNACVHELCNQTAISMAAKHGIDRLPAVHAVTAALAFPAVWTAWPVPLERARSETPPKIPSISPLSTTLRI